MFHQSVSVIAEILYKKGVKNVIISPGSRSAPLTLAMVRHPDIRTFVILDERSAGYIALGMAQELNQPVGLICTSGTAAINFHPAVAEAFYLQIPLIVLTADRPPEWIDQNDGQTIHQESIYQNHIKRFYSYPQEFNIPDVQWHCKRILSEAVILSMDFPSGPVHINLPFREPLYPSTDKKPDPSVSVRLIDSIRSHPTPSETSWEQLKNEWEKSSRVLIVSGQQSLDAGLIFSLNQFISKNQIPVISDVIANLSRLGKNLISFHDLILLKSNINNSEFLKPDLLITFGKSVISKNLKIFLRKFKPARHWHLQPAGYVPDTFQSLTAHIPIDPELFFNKAFDIFDPAPNRKEFLSEWRVRDNNTAKIVESFFPAPKLSELEVVYIILQHLPDDINLHLANSMPVRLVNYFGKLKLRAKVFSNRGTSGIDGSVSAAVGTALQSKKQNLLITGDMSFFYDRNAFWHTHIPDNLSIIILNNHGGGIFRMIDGPSGLPELETYFETYQPLTAENLANEYDFDYYSCDKRTDLHQYLESFFIPGKKVKILEIQTDSKSNKTIFDQFKSQFY
jgi:2-succinyl-5-enolpyruvyl-6-hydroxy-3-cyclohexene-1-carboxylate synthase